MTKEGCAWCILKFYFSLKSGFVLDFLKIYCHLLINHTKLYPYFRFYWLTLTNMAASNANQSSDLERLLFIHRVDVDLGFFLRCYATKEAKPYTNIHNNYGF